jgi:Peptidase family M23/Bacterial pre-peptidase C-terminal domain
LALIFALTTFAGAQDYAFPSAGDDYSQFYPTAYYDHGGETDWNCGGDTYSGHTGSDYGGGSWAGMDAGRDITAGAAGTVIATNDGVDDRCSTGDCAGGGGLGNYVKLQHADGRQTWYGHLKIWSVLVSVGQGVACGQKLGEMGSSGYSTGPHVHFTATNTSGARVDPFDPPSYWVDQGAYGGLPAAICEGVTPCTSAGRIRCGESFATANNAGGATSSHMAYGCGEYTYSGPELALSFATDRSEDVTLSLSGNSADVDLFVLDSEACDGAGAVACSISPDADPESVTFTATAGYTYTVVVDGYEGAVTG